MNKHPIDFSDLEGNLDDLAGAQQQDVKREKTFADAQLEYATGDTERARAQDKCRACNGTGQFHSKFTGRLVGDCFRCNGTGSVSKGTNNRVETRRRNDAQRDADATLQRAAWRNANADILAYLFAQRSNEFIDSLQRQFNDKGVLSKGQMDALRNGMMRQAARALEHEAQQGTNPRNMGVLDLGSIPEGRYAVPGGDTRLKVMIKRPVAPNKWAGYIFVSDAAAYGRRTSYGRQAPGHTYTGKIVEELRIIVADPRAAAVTYGRLTGTCAVCGRKLEDKDSVARGIGPVCAGTF